MRKERQVLKLVIDTNLWLRTLMGGPNSLFLLQAWQLRQYVPIVSDDLLDELREVSDRPRLRSRIRQEDVAVLLDELTHFGHFVVPTTIPPMCRDPKDNPVLAAAIDGRADAIVSGDADLRADEQLRKEMAHFGVALWGIETLRTQLALPPKQT